MSASRLARMANQIAASVPDQSAAAEQTAAHIRSFWTPAMIDALAAEVAAQPEVLTPAAHAALSALTVEHPA